MEKNLLGAQAAIIGRDLKKNPNIERMNEVSTSLGNLKRIDDKKF